MTTLLSMVWALPATAEVPAPVPAPISATTADGRPAIQREDGRWTLGDLPPTPVPPPLGAPERLGAWTVSFGRDPNTGRVLGGAATPNLDGPGALAVVCDGAAAVPLLVFGDADLAAWDPAAVGRERAATHYTIPVRRARRPLAGPIVALDAAEVLAVPAAALVEPLLALEGDVLTATRAGEARPGWPDTVRYALDGFREAWARVATACAEGIAPLP